MDFEQVIFKDFETAMKEIEYLPFKFVSLAPEGYVVVTKAILEREEEDLALANPMIEDQINQLLLIQHKNFLEIGATDFLGYYYTLEDTPEFIDKWFSREKNWVGLGHLCQPILIKDWRDAEEEMESDSFEAIEDLAYKNKREILEDEDIQQMGIEAYNGGLLVGWMRHQKMIDLEKNLEIHKRLQERQKTQNIEDK